jgi:hypothetical protein
MTPFVRRLLHNRAARQDASAALLLVNGEAIAAADVLRNDGLYLEDRLSCEIQQILARHPVDRPDHRRAVCRAGHHGDQFLRG